MNLDLQYTELHILPMMTGLFVCPKSSFSLNNRTFIKILRCKKLEMIFSISISTCLPHLLTVRIEECKKLKHIIEYDLKKNKMLNSFSSKTCLPKLKTLAVVNSNKLKCLFPVSITKELPELK